MDSTSMSMPSLFSSPSALFSIHYVLENGTLQLNNSLQGEHFFGFVLSTTVTFLRYLLILVPKHVSSIYLSSLSTTLMPSADSSHSPIFQAEKSQLAYFYHILLHFYFSLQSLGLKTAGFRGI